MEINVEITVGPYCCLAVQYLVHIFQHWLRKCACIPFRILHIAVCKTDKYMIKALLERLAREGLQALVDQENNKRQTPLYLAVFLNQPVMVAMFITFQANVNVLAQVGETYLKNITC